jgi:hypothetical protein
MKQWIKDTYIRVLSKYDYYKTNPKDLEIWYGNSRKYWMVTDKNSTDYRMVENMLSIHIQDLQEWISQQCIKR